VEAAGEAGRRRCDARRRREKGCKRVSVRAAGLPCNFRKRKGLFAKLPSGVRERGLRDTYAVKRGERRKPVRSFISPINLSFATVHGDTVRPETNYINSSR
jgi:hypothetical protein